MTKNVSPTSSVTTMNTLDTDATKTAEDTRLKDHTTPPAKISTTTTSALRGDSRRPNNPYALTRSQTAETVRVEDITKFVKLVQEFIEIVSNSGDYEETQWLLTWRTWVEDDILTATDLHQVAVTTEFPSTHIKSKENCCSSHPKTTRCFGQIHPHPGQDERP